MRLKKEENDIRGFRYIFSGDKKQCGVVGCGAD